ncbi:CBS domain-containing protein CBSX6-like [Durio zibethinus]|uniref:CBS domain-containing protein CBSX6-like n=1 Tax=Durio zibethinus TaxID=66656 RepID=A0A6P5YQN6_DURZI|nr:CBS domain-containing protein CBSX6-like [Durio zibethinus]XP_022742554.1 CBS domain-containing protein CBSX6-like [Durio zibethinus]XP_022742555.1 CBS domain-containing protein CBSX6-like [Durio zibethinus]XP_022742556.1 CBS domain-containing protein CBSX6-like [Durio zibethinus]
MGSVFLYHVVGDLTVGKPELVEFSETETVESAIRAIGESAECGIPVWRRRSHVGMIENNEMRQQRFVGILTSLDIVSFLAKTQCLEDQDKAMKTQVSDVVVPNNALLKIVDPGTRLIDAMEMMKQGVRRLLVPKSKVWKGMSKRFSILYNGKWLKNIENGSSNNLIANANPPSSSSTSTYTCDKFCCLSREDIIRFLIGCLGALAPLPLSSISSLGAINLDYSSIEASVPALEATQKHPGDPSAVAVVEITPDGHHKILGEISASKLRKCDYLAAAWALANLSAGQFVMGVEDNVSSRLLPDFSVNSPVEDNKIVNGVGSPRLRKFSSRSIGFNPVSPSFGASRSMYRGRSAPLTCKTTSSLAAVMAQMLSHRATHVWVTEDENDDVLVGVVGYADILVAVTKQPAAVIPTTRSITELGSEIQS